MNEKLGVKMAASASLTARRGMVEQGVAVPLRYDVTCYGPDGRVKWRDGFDNLVTTEGRTKALTEVFKAAGYSAAWYVGLIDNAGFSAVASDDTAAKITTAAPGAGTNGWAEATGYNDATRPAFTVGTIANGQGDNIASPARFVFNAAGTINGAFVNSSNAKGGIAGTLYSAGSFAVPRAVESGDTLDVEISLQA